MNISAIVCAYNEELTIEKVIKVLQSSKSIDELIVVNDGSTDHTTEILSKFDKASKIKIIQNKVNTGKGASMVAGIECAKFDTILFCDADLQTLAQSHISDLINTYKKYQPHMVIAGREDIKSILGKFMATISGERILSKAIIQPYLDIICKSGNGAEQIINHVYKNIGINYICSEQIGHILKYQRKDSRSWIANYIKQIGQMISVWFLLSLTFKSFSKTAK